MIKELKKANGGSDSKFGRRTFLSGTTISTVFVVAETSLAGVAAYSLSVDC
jgi:hypothetical protein